MPRSNASRLYPGAVWCESQLRHAVVTRQDLFVLCFSLSREISISYLKLGARGSYAMRYVTSRMVAGSRPDEVNDCYQFT
jgi:hypothetical protein